MPIVEMILMIVMIAVFVIAILAVLRGFLLWLYAINERMELQRQTNAHLSRIAELLDDGSAAPQTQPARPASGAISRQHSPQTTPTNP